MNVKKVFRAMTLLVVILAAGITLNAQVTKASDKKTSDVAVDQKVTVMTLDPKEMTLTIGEVRKITIKEDTKTADGKSSSGVEAAIATTWKSSNEKVAIVEKDGMVKAIAEGKVTITATAGNKQGKCEVLVQKPKTVAMTLDPKEMTLKPGETRKITIKEDTKTADGKPSSGIESAIATTWTSSNEKVAAVDKEGKVTAIAGGTATITATIKSTKNSIVSDSKSGDQVGTCKVIVEEKKDNDDANTAADVSKKDPKKDTSRKSTNKKSTNKKSK